MFRRGGKVNSDNGIVSGFRKGYANAGAVEQPDYADILSGYIQAPEEQKGLNSSDWLRIAAAGAEIMGAPATGRGGAIGALQAASQPLSSLGVDLATAKDARRSDYLTRKSAYDAAMGNAAVQSAADDVAYRRQVADREDTQTHQSTLQEDAQEHEIDIFDKTVTFENEKLQTEYDNAIELLKEEHRLNPYDFEKQYILGEGQKIIDEMANLDADSEEYKNLKNQFLNGLYGESTRAAAEEKASLLKDKDFLDAVDDIVGGIMETGGETEVPTSPYYGMTYSQVYDAIMKKMFAEIIVEVYVPPGFKDGGRVGLNLGGTPEDEYMRKYKEKELEGGQFPEPGDDPFATEDPVARSQDIDLTFAELRKRLPEEVSDQVIKLIISSEEAMIDFAKLQTPQDIQVFNKKYNTDLQMPTQVA
tara:strand:- start:5440 stop:6693 length:1254 start_codon:yes stop_codon:yes gene_type:complete